jgi:hypothetical protein
VDSDQEGMPDNWEKANGLDPANPEDRNGDFNGDGYTNLEKYINSIKGTGVTNPAIKFTSPTLNETFMSRTDINFEVEVASDQNRRIEWVDIGLASDAVKVDNQINNYMATEYTNVQIITK